MSLPGPEKTPGPGTYIVKDWVAGPKYTMQGRDEKDRSSDVPGPGQYELSGYGKVRDRSPGAVMTKASRTPSRHSKSVSEIPGPGNYQPLRGSSGPKWGFGQGARLKSAASDTPAPGSYNIPEQLGRGGFTMTGREERSITETVPGPGAYTPKMRDSSPTFKIGSSPRRDLVASSQVPGPGAYTPTRLRSSNGGHS